MMYKLDLKITKLDPSQYIDPPSEDEVYADISLDVLLDEGKIFNIFKIRWDVMCLLKWIIENKESIISEPPLNLIKSDFSIAYGIWNFYDLADLDNVRDSDMDLVFDYKTRHGLIFALRGVDINNVYIGQAVKGYEISYSNDNNHWSYMVDLPEFITSVENYYTKLKNEQS
ncbi:hypothetical protein KMZ15_03725 [Mycoavidus sp. HKI]|uniref:hypothetical protein n=1 Tax=Mycoavidus sp. HKI TaxID=2840467 RepID=UPI00215724F7|nr:hypothetical protein [Mycoavidus sp. HKI]UAW64779.2 hypothetical protein KMZ15_03725 [Mycoavidus sp. HKI]